MLFSDAFPSHLRGNVETGCLWHSGSVAQRPRLQLISTEFRLYIRDGPLVNALQPIHPFTNVYCKESTCVENLGHRQRRDMTGMQGAKSQETRVEAPQIQVGLLNCSQTNGQHRSKIAYFQPPGGMPNAGGGAPKPDGNAAAALPAAEAAATVAPIAAAIAAPMSPNPGGAPAQSLEIGPRTLKHS